MTRSWLIYVTLLAIWVTVVSWQTAEHLRVKQSARAALINRAKDISNTMGLVMRSQRRFGNVISRERLEGALRDLIKPGDVNAVALLNAAGEVVASAGTPIDPGHRSVVQNEQFWNEQAVLVMNAVDLGTNVSLNAGPSGATIVIPRGEMFRGDTNRASFTNFPPREPRPENFGEGEMRPPPPRGTNSSRGWPRGPRLSRDEYKSMAEKQGVHSCILAMSTEPVHASVRQDAWLRGIIGIFTTLSGLGALFAWKNIAKTSDLQLRLVRTSQLNTHLKEMNLAAAGLAHETRNPLNIIRGLAQMISKQSDASDETREKSRQIIDEADRVAGQLNEFINYSRPREIRAAPVQLESLLQEVTKALNYDIEEKNIQVSFSSNSVVIEADEQLLRQTFFNLLLNAIQAVEKRGQIMIRAGTVNGVEGFLEISDDGPGVAPEQRSEIFKPYFTTHQKGTGLGLAIVQQIVMAHGWDVEYLPNQPKGATFRISHMKLAPKK